jgi:hypothetical protein
MLGLVIGPVSFARTPVVSELFSARLVAHATTFNTGRFCRFWLQNLGHKSQSGCVVRLVGHWGLMMAHFFQHCSCGDSLARIEKQYPNFGFGC